MLRELKDLGMQNTISGDVLAIKTESGPVLLSFVRTSNFYLAIPEGFEALVMSFELVEPWLEVEYGVPKDD